MAETETAQPLPGEEARIDTAIDRILDPNTNSQVSLTDKQMAALDAIPAAKTRMVKQLQQVGVIKAPWAVDANGKPVPTRYEITTEGITQIIDTDENTAFPVTADPDWWWWLDNISQAVYRVITGPVVAAVNYSFAIKLGALIKGTTLTTKGKCRYESSYGLDVCWGGLLTKLDGYGGGTTYGTTYYSKSDPLNRSGMKDKFGKPTAQYRDLMQHEAAHVKQWKTYGLSFGAMYLLAEGIGRASTGKEGCGNIFEIMATLKKGGYVHC